MTHLSERHTPPEVEVKGLVVLRIIWSEIHQVRVGQGNILHRPKLLCPFMAISPQRPGLVTWARVCVGQCPEDRWVLPCTPQKSPASAHFVCQIGGVVINSIVDGCGSSEVTAREGI